ncbi:MAG: chorismate mutase [Anaerolineae bacterium]
MLACRGVRGATTCEANTREAILVATRELLIQMIERNGIAKTDIASVFFTTSPDLTAEFPAVAARELGWNHVAMLCAHEIAVPHGLRRCIRVMIHWNTEKLPEEIQHVYLHEAVSLRPDWSEVSSGGHRSQNANEATPELVKK